MSILEETRFTELHQDTQKIIESIVRAEARTKEYLQKSFESLKESEKAEHMKARAAFIEIDGRKRRDKIDLAILESLRFPEMNHRYETVAEAHKKTFLWVFRHPSSYDLPWSNFIKWLSESNGIYWIQGKAASGKSTLMRFIWHHDLTHPNLKLWSKDSQLLVAAFFFWNSGVPEEKSQLGLLRSLLYHVLQNHRVLISQVFPEDWVNKSELAANGLEIGPITWSLAQMKKAFTRLIKHAGPQLKMCFLIDGLDEYEGDAEEVAQYFKDLALVSEHTKFCLSSRPWPIFQDIYQGAPGLKVQDMTYDDIKLYVQENLERNRCMQELLDEDPQRSSVLIDELVTKANGVFLWVVLVVKSLIKGLRNGDDIVHLRRRLETIPSDLETLYDNMFSSIDPSDQEEASKMIQIFRASNHDLNLATLERAMRTQDYQWVIDLPDKSMFDFFSKEKTESVLAHANSKRMKARLSSRCMGLLEALKDGHIPTTSMEGLDFEQTSYVSSDQKKRKRKRDEIQHTTSIPSNLINVEDVSQDLYGIEEITTGIPNTTVPGIRYRLNREVVPLSEDVVFTEETWCGTDMLKISYLHRTVRDYLEQPRIWAGLLAKTDASHFDPCAALLMAYILELKTASVSEKSYLRGCHIENKIKTQQIPASEICKPLHMELNRIISSLWWNAVVNSTDQHYGREEPGGYFI